MSKLTTEQRLAFVRHDVAVLLEQLPNEILKAPIKDWDNVQTLLNNIAIACDLNDDEAERWKRVWWEVFVDDEHEGTRTIASFDTEAQSMAFIYDYGLRNPDVVLKCDEWWSDADGNVVEKAYPLG